MRHSRYLLVPLALLAALAPACTPPRPAPGAIAPAATRGSNADLEADLTVMDGWEARRATLVREDALKGANSPRASELSNAGAWLAFAREAYVTRRRSPAADEAFAEARRIIDGVEHARLASTATPVPAMSASASPPAKPVPRSSAAESTYPQLWARARALDAGTPAARQLAAQFEVELARAALAASNIACPVAPHLARAEQLLTDAESRQQQHLARLAADSAARAAAEARLAFLAGVREDERVRTRPVHFALDKDDLSAASRTLLDKVSAALKAHPGLIVVLEGHTDPRGSFEYNLDLSKRRARSVHRYLEGTGLDVSRIDVKGFGLTARRTTGSSREAFALDRRVMVRFSMEDGTPIAETEELMDVQVEEARRDAARRAGSTGARTTTRAPAKAAARPAKKPATRTVMKPASRTRTTPTNATTSRTNGGQR